MEERRFFSMPAQGGGESTEWHFCVQPAGHAPGSYDLTIPSVTPHDFAADEAQRAWFDAFCLQTQTARRTWSGCWTFDSDRSVQLAVVRLTAEHEARRADGAAYRAQCDWHGRRSLDG